MALDGAGAGGGLAAGAALACAVWASSVCCNACAKRCALLALAACDAAAFCVLPSNELISESVDMGVPVSRS